MKIIDERSRKFVRDAISEMAAVPHGGRVEALIHCIKHDIEAMPEDAARNIIEAFKATLELLNAEKGGVIDFIEGNLAMREIMALEDE